MEHDEDKNSSVSSSNNAAERHIPESIIKFRNYEPQTNFIEGLYNIEKSQPASIANLIQDKLDLALTDNTCYRIDPKLMEPKKVDWDLKRRIEKRMESLERDTRRSIAKHIKESKKRR